MDPKYFGESDAQFSSCNKYRYKLWRRWADGPSVAFLMLNPSTADAFRNDPTVERCHRRAVDMGFSALEVINIFAFRATDPKDLKKAKKPVGPLNNDIIIETICSADMTICSWGSHGSHQNRDQEIRLLIKQSKISPHILALTKFDQPRHPLYVSYSQKPILWTDM